MLLISSLLFGSNVWTHLLFNTLRPRENDRHFADDAFKRIFMNENIWISIKISLKFVPKGPINNIQALVLIMAWRRTGDKPLSEPMLVSLLTHICVTRPQWFNTHVFTDNIVWGGIHAMKILSYLIRTVSIPPPHSDIYQSLMTVSSGTNILMKSWWLTMW